MIDVLNHYVWPLVGGVNSLYNHRFSYSVLAGWHEQKFMGACESIFRIELFQAQASENVSKLCSKSFSNRFSDLISGAYVAVPTLHLLSHTLQSSKHKSLRQLVDQLCLRLPDLIVIASIVQSAAALYFNISFLQNSIALTFYCWSILEQGLFRNPPTENGGILFKLKGGKIIRFYDKILGKFNNWVSLPYLFFHGGPLTKIYTIGLSITLLPDAISHPIKSQFSRKIKQMKDNKLESLNFEPVKIASTPNLIQKCLLEQDDSCLLTQKHFEPFKIEDRFPDQTYDQVRAELRAKIEREMEEEKKPSSVKILDELHTYLIGANDEKELAASTLYIKNIYACILKDWESHRSILHDHETDLLCKTARALTIKSLCLELYSTQEEASSNEKKFEHAVALILQQFRDIYFSQTIQAFFKEVEKSRDTWTKEVNKQCLEWQQTRQGVSFSDSKYWAATAQFLFHTIKKNGVHVVSQAFFTSARNRHDFNALKVTYGKQLALSDYEEAVRDYELSLACSAVPTSLAQSDFSELLPFPLKDLVQLKYANSWFDDLVEAIIDTADTRLSINDVCALLCEQATGTEKEDAIFKESQRVAGLQPTRYAPEGADRYRAAATQFLKKHLPALLHNTGYLVKEEDTELEG